MINIYYLDINILLDDKYILSIIYLSSIYIYIYLFIYLLNTLQCSERDVCIKQLERPCCQQIAVLDRPMAVPASHHSSVLTHCFSANHSISSHHHNGTQRSLLGTRVNDEIRPNGHPSFCTGQEPVDLINLSKQTWAPTVKAGVVLSQVHALAV